jgi:hypothetical protein
MRERQIHPGQGNCIGEGFGIQEKNLYGLSKKGNQLS